MLFIVIEKKPRIIISHDCPTSVAELMFSIRERNNNRTSQSLEVIFTNHKPEIWIFGHHHETFTVDCGGTVFKCLAPLDAYEIPDLTW